jgi:pimeloyl-ACP methyl ester carboxylesterase
MVDAAARRGLRTVYYTRPGYGASTPHPGRTVADAAADTAAILDALGADTFRTVGWSGGGGPHALACAALLPDRCLAAASVAGVAPFAVPDLDWLAGIGADNVTEFGAALTGYLVGQAEILRAVTPADLAQAMGNLLPDVDRRQLTGQFAHFIAQSFRDAGTNGVAGWLDDDLTFVRDRGFPLGVGAPVCQLAGRAGPDGAVGAGPVAGRAPARATARLLPDEGHLSLAVGSFEDILDDLLRRGA